MTSASAAIWTAYDHVDAFLQNLRLQQYERYLDQTG
jgi:hypothetical protein